MKKHLITVPNPKPTTNFYPRERRYVYIIKSSVKVKRNETSETVRKHASFEASLSTWLFFVKFSESKSGECHNNSLMKKYISKFKVLFE